jgi:hypothetical protein
MQSDIPEPVIKAHITFDRLMSALASISLKNSEELEAFRDLLEEKIPDVVSTDDFIESQALYFILRNVHQALQQKGLE